MIEYNALLEFKKTKENICGRNCNYSICGNYNHYNGITSTIKLEIRINIKIDVY